MFSDKIFKTKFDLIVSLGEDCACSSYLRKFNLQSASYPFDWLFGAPLKNKLELLLSNFEGFLDKKDLVHLEKNPNCVNDYKNEYYMNTENKIIFLHDFPINMSFDEGHKFVFEKYQRRIKRLYEKIEKSKKVLFVWLGKNQSLENDKILEYQRKLTEKFNNENIYLLILENTPNYKEKDFKEEKISEKILKIKYDTKTTKVPHTNDEYLGNIELNEEIFSKLKFNMPKSYKIKKLFYNLIIKQLIAIFAWNKEYRRKIRNKISHSFNLDN